MSSDTDPIYEGEKAAAAPKRISATNLQGNDQIIAISALSIHSFLDARWDAAIGKKDKRIKEFNHTTDKGTIRAVMSAPRLRLSVPSAPQSVYFVLNFESGSFDWWKGQGPQAKLKQQNLAGWQVVFSVSFALKELVQVPAKIRDKIKFLLKPGQYSVSQLVLSLSAAVNSSLNWAGCVTPNMPEDQDQRVEVQSAFQDYITRYLKYLETGPYSVLGYAIKVEDPSAAKDTPAPSFPPRLVQVRTQEYVANTEDFKSKYPGILDCIIFEEMTEDRKFPDIPYDPVKAGNWVAPGIESSLTLSKQVFIDRFVLPRFQLLNEQAISLANDAYYWVHKTKDKKMFDNDWFIADEGKPTSPQWTSNATDATYSKKFERKRSNNSFFGGQWRDNVTTDITNTVKWTAGTGKMVANVKIKQDRDRWNGGHGGNPDTLDGGTTEIEWSTDIEFTSVKEGQLDVRVNYSTPKLSYKYSSSQSFWDWGGSQKAGYENAAMEAMKSGVKFEDAQVKMQKALAGQSKFIFPGAGEFDFKDPTFNNNGDMLLGLTYVSKKLVIDDDFHLQTYDTSAKKTSPEVDQKWIRVSGTADGSTLELVADQKDATLFQIDDGSLVVDNNQKPTGLRAMLKTKITVDPKGPFVHDIIRMANRESFDKREHQTQTLECTPTASRFTWAMGDMNVWYQYFCLDESNSRVCLFTGDEEDPGTVKAFGVHAIY